MLDEVSIEQCSLPAEAIAFLPERLRGWGVAQVPVPLPYAPWLRGVAFTTQAAVLQAPGAWFGLDFTAALMIVVGDGTPDPSRETVHQLQELLGAGAVAGHWTLRRRATARLIARSLGLAVRST